MALRGFAVAGAYTCRVTRSDLHLDLVCWFDRSVATARLQRIVAAYVEHHQADAADEIAWFGAERGTDEEAVSYAAHARLPKGKVHPHQWHVKKQARLQSSQVLSAPDVVRSLRAAGAFDDIFEILEETILPIDGIGPLAVYDTAVRIGGRFDREPKKIYLHAGTSEGAKTLGLDVRRKTLDVDELDPAFSPLRPREIEAVLCLYRDVLVSGELLCTPHACRSRKHRQCGCCRRLRDGDSVE